MNITKIIRARPAHSLLQKNSFHLSGASTSAQEKIEIPKRIPRGPTDILRALESTVGRDLTAAHYKYHDDPFLIPMSNTGKRTFAMAQEAGRKAAHWVRQQHPDLFQHKEADPPIEPFFPPITYTSESVVTEEDLNRLIRNAQVSDATIVYKTLTQNGGVSPETTQKMLELVCFQNNEDALSEEFIEERWFKQSTRTKERVRKTWKDGDLAEELFIGIENPTALTYSAIIQGMVRYHQVDRAWQLFQEAEEKGIALNTNTFNAIISVVDFIKENHEMRWTLVTNLLIQMQKSALKPNLGTLNSVLYAVQNMGSRQAKEVALKVLAEFKKLEIEPSLASWTYILNIYYKERSPSTISTILVDIMNEIDQKEHTIRDLKDTNFFVYAMEVCRYQLRDVDLARRVNELLHFGNNYDLIGDSYKESIYFRHYFALLCREIPLEEFMIEVYYKLVPHIYVPEPGIMSELLKQIDLNGAFNYVPKLWSDMVVFDHTHREELIESIVNIMDSSSPVANANLSDQFSYIAWDICNRIEARNENKLTKINFTGETLGKIMKLLLRNKDFDKGIAIMDRLVKNQHTIVGVPKIDALSQFIDHCIINKAPSRALVCIQYASDCGFPEAKNLAQELHKQLNLDEEFISRLTRIVGDITLPNETA